ncbi:C39 family peptidase [Mycobacterium palustre]|uniref:Peptidase C39-like domain-containing protein n=1 Tax=Mycobacterium palustre TaxID=153971 RepID=A0A1X1Z7P7_9MYCO|nr:C39 family peptidase [Mycobacterium palustre]MCV7102131.1 hypothetical protein [Mycobacterium palustre]ORW19281.1 hypothetical protein AWC19_17150 [Mycobacterium palustre]
MTSAANGVAAAGRGLAALACLGVGAAWLIAPAAGARAETGLPVPDAEHELGMYGDPAAAARYWHRQHSSDCGELAVADVVGQIVGRAPTEAQITALAEATASAMGPGPVWRSPDGDTDIGDLPVLLWHYGIRSDNVQTDIGALEQDLAAGRKVIALVNAETIWDRPGRRDAANHFVVVTGIDTRARVVHLNDSGIITGRDERIPVATFERAWAPNHNSAIVTR